MTSIKERSIKLHNRIFDCDYYVNLYTKVLERNGMSINIHQFPLDRSDEELVNMWNDFWNVLPDDKAIRRAPFFELCDLAEEIFN